MIRAVIQAVTRVNVACGIELVRYWISVASKGRSASAKAGVRHRFVQMSVDRQPMSDTARPECCHTTNLKLTKVYSLARVRSRQSTTRKSQSSSCVYVSSQISNVHFFDHFQ